MSVGDVIVRVDPRYFRPAEVETLLGDLTLAKEKLGWVPTTTWTRWSTRWSATTSTRPSGPDTQGAGLRCPLDQE